MQTTLVSSLAAIYGPAAMAQEAAPAAPAASAAAGSKVEALDTILVTGYRASVQRAMNVKRNADSIVDAISAEDIGKFPDRNAAESLAHLPGISVDRLYGEGEKVSINGTDPQLNRVLVNGQTIASGDWGGSPGDTQGGRTFNYTLLAPEIIGLMEVYKAPEARIDEGSIGGTVIIHTRKPLDLPANTLRGSVGYLYNDRSEQGDPRASVLYSWKNQSSDFGALIALTHDKQRLKQASVQFFCGYTSGAGIKNTTAITGGGDPATSRVPVCLDSSLFDQQRTRDGAQGALQWKVDKNNELNLTGVYVKGKYDNFSQSRYVTPVQFGNMTQANVSGGLVNSGTFVPNKPSTENTDVYGQLDTNYRTSDLSTKSLNLTHEYTGDEWKLKSQVGYTKATGGTTPEYLMKYLLKSGGYSFKYGPQSAGLVFDNPAASNWRLDGPSGDKKGDQAGGIAYDRTNDNERYGQVDFSKDVSWGPIKEVLVGAKFVHHENGKTRMSNSLFPTAPVSLTDFSPVLVDSKLFSGMDVDAGISSWPTASPDAVKSYLNGLPGAQQFNFDAGSSFLVKETTKNLFTQFNYEYEKFRGNFGVRYVNTTDTSNYYLTNSQGNGVLTTAEHTYRKFLPSFNLVYDLDSNKVLRASVAKVLARSRYSDLAGSVSRDDVKLNGGGGNPDLKPYESTNFDLAGEWYFQPRSMLGFEAFYRKVGSYVINIANDQQIFNPLTKKVETYSISSPVNAADAKVKGLSLIYQQDIAYGLGVETNYTYSTSDASNGLNMPYLSRNVFTFAPYYESGPYSLRLVYNYRTSYFTQVGRAEGKNFAGGYKSLDLSASYQINQNIGLSFNASNLLDSTYLQYDGTPNAPVGFYKNGRLFTLGLNFKM
ncbi:TonB-dependent receptor [Pelomonas cellulosilytica]|uniref:TonB-dependent receptor n=1 Tax=Pelomonas cellulosilytica TaxID=2906762 RepID=A0ABS8XT58_9BURK|nr:TonB-dependent receptor [Pelomonas sp. P8]MCE4553918.1 TonB-dependent receptor [Pelomonas sp. P8]